MGLKWWNNSFWDNAEELRVLVKKRECRFDFSSIEKFDFSHYMLGVEKKPEGLFVIRQYPQNGSAWLVPAAAWRQGLTGSDIHHLEITITDRGAPVLGRVIYPECQTKNRTFFDASKGDSGDSLIKNLLIRIDREIKVYGDSVRRFEKNVSGHFNEVQGLSRG